MELVATLLLALATVATAWSGYQSTRWNGEQAKAGARANALRIESAKAAGLANAQTVVDVSVFTNWVNAYAENKPSWRTSTSHAFAKSSNRQSRHGSRPGPSRIRMLPRRLSPCRSTSS